MTDICYMMPNGKRCDQPATTEIEVKNTATGEEGVMRLCDKHAVEMYEQLSSHA